MNEKDLVFDMGVDVLKQLEQLDSKEQTIVGQLESGRLVTDKVAKQFLDAQHVIYNTRQDVLADHENIAAITHVGTTALTAIGQLETLKGILDQAAIESAGQEYVSLVEKVHAQLSLHEDGYTPTKESERFMAAATSIGSIGVGETVVVPAEPTKPEQSQPEAVTEAAPKPIRSEYIDRERAVEQVSVTFTEKVVRIGDKGRIVPFRSKLAEEGKARDYSEQNRNALRFLIEHPGQEFKTAELWAAMFPGGKPYGSHDSHKMEVTRNWLLDLSHHNQRLIGWSGKRGRGSFYWVSPNFELALTEREKKVWPGRAVSEEVQTPSTVTAIDLSKASEGKRANTELLPNITLGDFYVLANKINGFNQVLDAYLKPTISKELMASLDPYKPDLTHLKGNSQAIESYGQNVLDKIEELFTDEDALLELIDVLEEDSPEAEFVEYIYSQLEGPEDRSFIRSLISARRTHEITTYGKMPLDIKAIVVSKDGEIIWPIKLGGVWVKQLPRPKKQVESSEAKVPLLENSMEHEVHEAKEAPVRTPAVKPRETPAPIARAPKKEVEREPLFIRENGDTQEKIYEDERASARRRQKFDEALERVEHIADRFLSSFSHDATVKSGQLSAAIGSFRGVFKGIDVEQEFTILEAVIEDLKVFKKSAPLFAGSKSGNKALENAIERRVNLVLARHLESQS